jgi:hypothetical protein
MLILIWHIIDTYHIYVYIYIYLNATVDERHPEPVLETINYERL